MAWQILLATSQNLNETRVRSALDDVASRICQALCQGWVRSGCADSRVTENHGVCGREPVAEHGDSVQHGRVLSIVIAMSSTTSCTGAPHTICNGIQH